MAAHALDARICICKLFSVFMTAPHPPTIIHHTLPLHSLPSMPGLLHLFAPLPSSTQPIIPRFPPPPPSLPVQITLSILTRLSPPQLPALTIYIYIYIYPQNTPIYRILHIHIHTSTCILFSTNHPYYVSNKHPHRPILPFSSTHQ